MGWAIAFYCFVSAFLGITLGRILGHIEMRTPKPAPETLTVEQLLAVGRDTRVYVSLAKPMPIVGCHTARYMGEAGLFLEVGEEQA